MPRCNAYRRYKKPGLPINQKQITIIKMAQGQLAIDDDTYRDMLEERYKVRSCKALTYDEASAFIRELEGKGFSIIPNKAKKPVAKVQQPKRPPIPRGGNVVALANQGELDKINKIAELITWRETNGLALFLEKRMGIKRGKVRTSEEAYLALEGLKKMFANQMKAQYGENWWTLKFDHEGISEFIRLHKPAEWR